MGSWTTNLDVFEGSLRFGFAGLLSHYCKLMHVIHDYNVNSLEYTQWMCFTEATRKRKMGFKAEVSVYHITYVFKRGKVKACLFVAMRSYRACLIFPCYKWHNMNQLCPYPFRNISHIPSLLLLLNCSNLKGKAIEYAGLLSIHVGKLLLAEFSCLDRNFSITFM